jgi:hypothetical protein
MKEYILENAQIQAAFDAQTGALLSLLHKPTGWAIQNRGEACTSFRLFVPLPERLYNMVDGRKQKIAQASFDENKQQILFTWEGLQSEHGGWLDIRLDAAITLNDSGLHFEMDVHNHSQYTVESCAYPYLGSLHKPDDTSEMVRASCNYGALVRKPLYPQFPNERGYWGTEYPIQMVPTPESQFVMVLAKEQGLYIGCHDTSAEERIEFTFRLIPGHGRAGYVPEQNTVAGCPVRIECYAEHLPFVQPGESYPLLPVVLAPFTGDWHAGADIYRTWRDTWIEKPPVPAWLKEVHSWQQIQMTSWGDTLNIRYEDLDGYAQECAEHGVSAVQLVGWTRYGQDGRLPDHDTDPRLGSRDELKEAITAMQARGVRVVLYEKYTCADINTEWYQERLHRLASKDIFGNTHGHEGWRYDTPAHLAGVNTRPYAWMCMNAAEWQDIAVDEIRKSLELNPDGVLLDESMWHGSNAFYCFDNQHGHRHPAYNFCGDAFFEKKLRALIEETNPDLLLAGEGPYDLQNQHYSLTYLRAGEDHIPVIRYIDPDLPMMNWVYGFDDRELVNRCLLYRYIISYEPRHFRGRLSEFPATLAYGKAVDALRSRYKDYLWDADFQDTRGAAVVVGDKAHPLYSVFKQKNANRRAVVIANHDPFAEITAQVCWEDPLPGPLVWATPENPDPQISQGAVLVRPRSVAVVMQGMQPSR